ncbi:MAG: hypothetical protein FWE27_07175 [Defluviitaleaceae bacterium]|nr:hypothetical protein [Defluviitaleaceae bacterium]
MSNTDLERILLELNQCREDERNGRNSIVTAILVGITAIGVLGVSSIESSTILNLSVETTIWVFFSIIGVVASYIFNIGLISALRYHYLRDLENSLTTSSHETEKDFFCWTELNSPIVTLKLTNVVRSPYSLLHFSNLLTAIICILLMCNFLFPVIDIEIGKSIMKMMIPLLPVLFISSWYFGTSKSQNVYEYAKERAMEKRYKNVSKLFLTTNKNSYQIESKLSISFIKYLIYPRPSDTIKVFFILYGFIIGSVLSHTEEQSTGLISKIIHFVLVFLVFEFFSYQARYQWNDIRGYVEDDNNKQSKERNRLNNVCKEIKLAVSVSSIVIFCKLTFAIIFTLPNWFNSGVPLRWGILFIFLLSFCYEIVRSCKMGLLAIFFVGFGYPMRLFFGYWLARPDLFTHIGIYDENLIPLLLLLLATLTFGWVFVTLTWALECAACRNTTKKPHILLLGRKLKDIEHTYPLREKGYIHTWWNWAYIATVLSLALAAFWLTVQSNEFSIHMTILWGLLSLSCVFSSNKNRFISFSASCIISIILFFSYPIKLSLYSFIILAMIAYPCIYVLFRNTNYKEMSEGISRTIFAIKASVLIIVKLYLGNSTYNLLFVNKKK